MKPPGLTLDNNCIIDLQQNREDASRARSLVLGFGENIGEDFSSVFSWKNMGDAVFFGCISP
jgi:hypothetical protein